jgi:hypothetical protein
MGLHIKKPEGRIIDARPVIPYTDQEMGRIGLIIFRDLNRLGQGVLRHQSGPDQDIQYEQKEGH